ncbi:MAG: hypothetical protein M1338_01465 [Patescibacteria group bacterium]|nr:hypothetical protein [Patescibacteria group bacterium]
MENQQIEEKKGFWQRVWTNKTSRIIFVAIILVLISSPIALGYYSYKYYQEKQNNELTKNQNISVTPSNTATVSVSLDAAKTSASTKAAAKTIDSSALKLVTKQTGYCKALAPEDWAIISNQQASGVDVFSPDKTLHAGWGITFVYSYMYNNEDDFLNAWMPLAGFEGFSMSSPTDMGYGFTKRDFTSSNNKKGIIFYKKYDVPDLGGYVMSVYMADTATDLWDAKGALAIYSAISLRCTTQLRPSTASLDLEKSNPSSESDNPEMSLSDKWQEAIMGYENVYSPSTGEHYEAPLNSKWESGPDGAGYYRSAPNGYEKLANGFGDY